MPSPPLARSKSDKGARRPGPLAPSATALCKLCPAPNPQGWHGLSVVLVESGVERTSLDDPMRIAVAAALPPRISASPSSPAFQIVDQKASRRLPDLSPDPFGFRRQRTAYAQRRHRDCRVSRHAGTLISEPLLVIALGGFQISLGKLAYCCVYRVLRVAPRTTPTPSSPCHRVSLSRCGQI